MDYLKIAESSLLYIMVVFGILVVLGIAVLFLCKAWKRALDLGISKKQIWNVVKGSLSLSLVPSIAIVVGFFSLAAMLGVPWPWYRLSVIGSVTYEIMAADMALKSLGKEMLDATGGDFTLIMFVMSLCICSGLILLPIFGKKIQTGAMKMKEKDPKWGPLGHSTLLLTILVVLVVPMILAGGVTFFTLLTSLLIAVILGLLIHKAGQKWLTNFVLAFCLVGAMASSVLWTRLLG